MKSNKRIAKPEWFITAEDHMHSTAALVRMGRIPSSIEYHMATGPILWMLRGVHGTRSNTWALILTAWYYWGAQITQKWWEATHRKECREIDRDVAELDNHRLENEPGRKMKRFVMRFLNLLFGPFAIWLFDAEWIPLGRFAPWVLAVGLGSWPNKVKQKR